MDDKIKKNAMDSSSKASSWSHDFVVLSEFCELEGPVTRTVIPGKARSFDFNFEDFVLNIMAVEHSRDASCPVDNLSADSEPFWTMSYPKEQCFVYVQYITLLDIFARGYVRPFCLSYISRDSCLMDRFSSIRKCFLELTFSLKKANQSVFLQDVSLKVKNLSKLSSSENINEENQLNNNYDIGNSNNINNNDDGNEDIINDDDDDGNENIYSSSFGNYSKTPAEELRGLQLLQERLSNELKPVGDENQNENHSEHEENELYLNEEEEKEKEEDPERKEVVDFLSKENRKMTSGSKDSVEASEEALNKSMAQALMDVSLEESSVYFEAMMRPMAVFCNLPIEWIDQELYKIVSIGSGHLYGYHSILTENENKNFIEGNDIDCCCGTGLAEAAEAQDLSAMILQIGVSVSLNFCLSMDSPAFGGGGVRNQTQACSDVSLDMKQYRRNSFSMGEDFGANLALIGRDWSQQSLHSCASKSSVNDSSDVVSPMGSITSNLSSAFDDNMMGAKTRASSSGSYSDFSGENISQIRTVYRQGSSTSEKAVMSGDKSEENLFDSSYDSRLAGYGILSLCRSYSSEFMKTLIFSLLSGRPLFILASPANRFKVCKYIHALSIFVVPNTQYSHSSTRKRGFLWGSVIPWIGIGEEPLQLEDLQFVRLAGIATKTSEYSSGILSSALCSYSSILKFEKEILVAPPYETSGIFLSRIIGGSWHSESAFLAHIYVLLHEFASKSFLFYHICCIATHRYTDVSTAYTQLLQKFSYLLSVDAATNLDMEQEENNRMIYSGLRQKMGFFKQFQISSSDQAIVEHLAEVVKSQQALELQSCEVAPLVKLDLRQCVSLHNRKVISTSKH